MKIELNIPVRELVEHLSRSGDLELEFRGAIRAAEGIRAHRKIQKSRPAGYLHEVPVSWEFENERFRLRVGGRIDGLFTDKEGVAVEEIKTTRKDPRFFAENENPLHWSQVKSYAFIYAEMERLERIGAQLTYFRPETEEILEIRKDFGREALSLFFRDLVGRYLEWAEKLIEWRKLRDDSILRSEFPYPAYRPGQRRMAEEVYRTIRSCGQLLAQASTGIGKTMAVLFPSIKALGTGLTSRIFYLTARTTGKDLAETALGRLRENGLRLKSLTLTAKEKICFSPGAACSGDECAFAEGYYDRVREAVGAVFEQDDIGRETVETVARRYRVCPFEFSLEISLWADCLICDYNYAFDPRVYLRRLFPEETGDGTFLIDEAHNLVDRGREMFSAQLIKSRFLELRRAIRGKEPKIFRSLGKIDAWLKAEMKSCGESGGFRNLQAPPESLLPLLRTFLRAADGWLIRNLRTPFRESLLERYFEASIFTGIGETFDADYTAYSETYGKDLKLKLFCLDPAVRLGEALDRCKAAIFFSGTLTPAGYFRRVFGCAPSARELVLPTPFPSENLCVLVSEKTSTAYDRRIMTREKVAREILALIRERRGNYLLFFPSYVYLGMIHEAFMAAAPEAEVLVQTPGMTEAERSGFLECFSRENRRSLVGFAVMGGVFGEGIDLAGDFLSGAVIVGVGLPGISPERDLIRDHYAGLNRMGFEFAYLYPGVARVFQAAGRVIRTEKDRGIVLLIDDRFSTPRYRRLFPPEWRPVRVRGPEEVACAVKKFWEVSD